MRIVEENSIFTYQNTVIAAFQRRFETYVTNRKFVIRKNKIHSATTTGTMPCRCTNISSRQNEILMVAN